MNGRQQKTLALIPKFSASISIVFSSLVIYCILRKKKTGKRGNNVYDHLLLGVSVADLFGSLWYAMSTRPIPKSSNVWGASGNQTTCDIQGFFIQGGLITSILYMGSISFYFLLLIRFQWKQSQFKKYAWCFHFIPIAWGLSTAIATIPLKISNNATLWCYIAPSDDPDRGRNADFFRMLFFYGPLFFMFVVVTVNVIVIVTYVRRVTTKAELASFKSGAEDYHAGDLEFDDYVNEENSREEHSPVDGDKREETSVIRPENPPSHVERQPVAKGPSSSSFTLALSSQRSFREKTRYSHCRRKASRQNFGFALAFYWTWVPISCVRMLQLGNHSVPFWLLVISAITTPVQGVPVLLVHYYPKYKKFIEKRKTNSKVTFMRWIRTGMATTVADGGDENPRHEEDKDSIHRGPNAEKKNAKYEGILAERESHMRGIPMSSIPSEPVYGLKPIQENESSCDEESGLHDSPTNAPTKDTRQSTNVVSDYRELTRRPSLKDEDYGTSLNSQDVESRPSYVSESSISIPISVFKNDTYDSNISFLSEHSVSSNARLNEEENMEMMPERGDESRWNSHTTSPKTDFAQDSYCHLQSVNSNINPPKPDNAPKRPRRLPSNTSNDA